MPTLQVMRTLFSVKPHSLMALAVSVPEPAPVMFTCTVLRFGMRFQLVLEMRHSMMLVYCGFTAVKIWEPVYPTNVAPEMESMIGRGLTVSRSVTILSQPKVVNKCCVW